MPSKLPFKLRRCPTCLPGVPVTVYQGQLDLICCTLGAEAWMAKLRWPGMKGFQAAKRRPFYTDEDDSSQGAEAVVEHHGTPQQQGRHAQPHGAQKQQQDTPAAGGLEERQPRRTAGFVREHGPLALITVMSAGGLLWLTCGCQLPVLDHIASPACASSPASECLAPYSACDTCHLFFVLKLTVLHAGHMIPIDQPRSALRMVRMIMDRHSQVSGGQQPARPSDIADSTD